MKKKICYQDMIKQLQKDPQLSPGQTLNDLRAWIDNITEEHGQIPLGILQAYAYILMWTKKEEKTWESQNGNRKQS